MKSANDLLHRLEQSQTAGNPGFSAIVAFDYYDGPERGVAVYPSGAGVRFTSLGDSPSRIFRAFELHSIEGDWRQEVETLMHTAGPEDDSKLLVPVEANGDLQRFDDAVSSAAATGLYVGVGKSNFDWMYVSALEDDELQRLRLLDGSPDAFRSTHRLVKRGRARR